MARDLNEDHKGYEPPANYSTVDDSFSDIKAKFEIWLDSLKACKQAHSASPPFSGAEEQAADFFVECGADTDCRIIFTGVLNIGGYLSGSLQTESGTLVTRAPGRINADIDVCEAFIDSAVNGNINATGRVVLNSHARVVGNINTPALSIKGGAIFEGDYLVQDAMENEIETANNRGSEAVGFLSAVAMVD